ncbi:MAG: FHA domain-containing protein [Roseobacter sp.]
MRFIRDIIKDKRSTADMGASSQGEAPLVLEAPVFDDAAEDLILTLDNEETTAPPKAAPRRVRPAQTQGDDHDEVEELLRVIEQSDDADIAILAAASEQAKTKSGDPFARLRDTEENVEARSQSPSPLRTRASSATPANPSEAQPAATFDLDGLDLDDMIPLADAMDAPLAEMPAPAVGRGANRSGRVKTRLLGFSGDIGDQDDPFAKSGSLDSAFPVGWLVVISDQGRGACFALHDGVSTIGRSKDQTVCLNFGDNSISRSNHVSVAYDAEQNKFFIGHGGKSNLVRLNSAPLLSTEELRSKDVIRLGETKLRFIALCEDDFRWASDQEQITNHG